MVGATDIGATDIGAIAIGTIAMLGLVVDGADDTNTRVEGAAVVGTTVPIDGSLVEGAVAVEGIILNDGVDVGTPPTVDVAEGAEVGGAVTMAMVGTPATCVGAFVADGALVGKVKVGPGVGNIVNTVVDGPGFDTSCTVGDFVLCLRFLLCFCLRFCFVLVFFFFIWLFDDNSLHFLLSFK